MEMRLLKFSIYFVVTIAFFSCSQGNDKGNSSSENQSKVEWKHIKTQYGVEFDLPAQIGGLISH